MTTPRLRGTNTQIQRQNTVRATAWEASTRSGERRNEKDSGKTGWLCVYACVNRAVQFRSGAVSRADTRKPHPHSAVLEAAQAVGGPTPLSSTVSTVDCAVARGLWKIWRWQGVVARVAVESVTSPYWSRRAPEGVRLKLAVI